MRTHIKKLLNYTKNIINIEYLPMLTLTITRVLEISVPKSR